MCNAARVKRLRGAAMEDCIYGVLEPKQISSHLLLCFTDEKLRPRARKRLYHSRASCLKRVHTLAQVFCLCLHLPEQCSPKPEFSKGICQSEGAEVAARKPRNSYFTQSSSAFYFCMMGDTWSSASKKSSQISGPHPIILQMGKQAQRRLQSRWAVKWQSWYQKASWGLSLSYRLINWLPQRHKTSW